MDGTSSEADSCRGSSPAGAERRSRLERVLREALLATHDAALIAAEHAALRGLAERHRGRGLVLEPVVVDMVGALLSAAFGVRVDNSPTGIEMSRTIAKSMWSDPAIRERIESLWSRLAEQS